MSRALTAKLEGPRHALRVRLVDQAGRRAERGAPRRQDVRRAPRVLVCSR
jgi:hypothetical protein